MDMEHIAFMDICQTMKTGGSSDAVGHPLISCYCNIESGGGGNSQEAFCGNGDIRFENISVLSVEDIEEYSGMSWHIA